MTADKRISSHKINASAVPAHHGGGRPLSGRPTGPGSAFANFLIDFLPNLKMTNEQLADRLGYKRANIISMWKTGRTKITLDVVWRLHDILGTDLAYLLALYFEQYAGDSGIDHFPEIAKMMGRVTTPEEWEIIKVVRQARQYHTVPLKADQRSVLKKLFALSGVPGLGPLRDVEANFASAGDRRRFARRGYSRDMSISDIEEVESQKALCSSDG
jgi:transcriptional regulator with XRE-family HTH domain